MSEIESEAMGSETPSYSSIDYPEKERFDIWREMFGRKIGGFDMEHSDSRPFFNQTRFFSFGVVGMSRHATTAIRFRRTREIIAGEDQDFFGVAICVAGTWEVMQGQRRMILEGRTAGLIDSRKVLEGGLGPDTAEGHQSLLSLRVPREELAKRVPKVERLVMSPFRSQEGLNLLRDYLGMLEREFINQYPNLGELVGDQILDIVALLCNDREAREPSAGGVRAARRAAVIRYLENHFTEPGLTATQIAAELKISRRYLYDLLDTEGESVTQILNRLRLARAGRLLADPRYRHFDIATIAYQSGFSDLSYFYRQFRQRFQETPGAFRVRCVSQGDTENQLSDSERKDISFF
ncbi:helix-turn-helix domain-containing protein [Methylococcus mesophilus]|uniref:helix-turn-helix domain-containing protein n=1 Tax=Methylococcus mesophilus TaxID=2993564 RepID=UPI00224B6141|nr:helix-turn-helix domain-containing protein [Methylococcus mesophilus]UZR27249.1 helix-turn-helix domain-containing protein [Methylococcus mesophilus]